MHSILPPAVEMGKKMSEYVQCTANEVHEHDVGLVTSKLQ